MTHEVIVYRNPMEKALWDFWMGPVGGPIVMWLCLAAMAVLVVYVLAAVLSGPYNRAMWKLTKNRRYLRF